MKDDPTLGMIVGPVQNALSPCKWNSFSETWSYFEIERSRHLTIMAIFLPMTSIQKKYWKLSKLSKLPRSANDTWGFIFRRKAPAMGVPFVGGGVLCCRFAESVPIGGVHACHPADHVGGGRTRPQGGNQNIDENSIQHGKSGLCVSGFFLAHRAGREVTRPPLHSPFDPFWSGKSQYNFNQNNQKMDQILTQYGTVLCSGSGFFW